MLPIVGASRGRGLFGWATGHWMGSVRDGPAALDLGSVLLTEQAVRTASSKLVLSAVDRAASVDLWRCRCTRRQQGCDQDEDHHSNVHASILPHFLRLSKLLCSAIAIALPQTHGSSNVLHAHSEQPAVPWTERGSPQHEQRSCSHPSVWIASLAASMASNNGPAQCSADTAHLS